MNARGRDDFFSALAAIRPGGWDALSTAAAFLDAAAAPGARWSAVVPADASEARVGLRVGLRPGADLAALARGLGVAVPGAAFTAEAALLEWDGRAGRVAELVLAGPTRAGRRAGARLVPGGASVWEERLVPFARAAFASEDLKARARALHARAPVAFVHAEADGENWRFAFAAPEPWRRFLRLDSSAPFAAEAASLTAAFGSLGVLSLGYRGAAARVELG